MKLEFESTTSSALPYAGNSYAAAVEENVELDAAKISQMLQAGIKAAQAGERGEARRLLAQVTDAEPKNETAWLWMASISEYPEELIIFLNNVLSINPHNARAIEWMQATKSLLAKTFVRRGVDACRDANTEFARQCFLQAIVHDPESEAAWLQLAAISDAADEKAAHLQKVLSINPANETAKTALHAARNQAAETILRKANSAAVAGERAAAREMLQEVFKHAPEHEAAWILKSYLADSFSEKITCFEKVLTLNPENEMAISGLASLREMMARTEAKKIEQAAMLAALEQSAKEESAAATAIEEQPAEEVLFVGADQIVYAEDEDENSPTQKLEFPPIFPLIETDANQESERINEPTEAAASLFENVPQFFGSDASFQDQEIFPQISSEERDFENHTISATNEFMNHINQPDNEPTLPSSSNEVMPTELVRTNEEFQSNQFVNTF